MIPLGAPNQHLTLGPPLFVLLRRSILRGSEDRSQANPQTILSLTSSGSSLALCELYLALTAISLSVLPYMRLYDTTDEDVRYDHDMLIPMAKAGSKGVRVIIV